MTKQELLSEELFQVFPLNGRVYNRAEYPNGVPLHFQPNNEIWLRVPGVSTITLRPIPITNENVGVENVIANNPDQYHNYADWQSMYKDPKYLSFGAKLDLNCEDYQGLNKLGRLIWKTHSATVNGTKYYWVKLVFESPVTSIPQEAFEGINVYTLISELSIPNSVTWIGPKAFTQLGGLKSIILGSGVKTMKAAENKDFYGETEGYPNTGGSWVFDDVLNLWHITCLAKEAPQTDFFCFSTQEIHPSAEAGQNTIYEMSKHYIEGDTLVNDKRGVEAPQEGNINTLTLVEGAVGYDAAHYSRNAAYQNNWVNLVGGIVDGQEKPNYGFTKEYINVVNRQSIIAFISADFKHRRYDKKAVIKE